MTNFYSIGAFPKVIGAIDGTLIPIRAPAKEEHLYVCHKGFHAINQPRSQGLSSLPPLVVGTETLVAAGHVTIYPSKTAEWVGTQVHLVERTINYHSVALPFQQIFLPPRFWVVT